MIITILQTGPSIVIAYDLQGNRSKITDPDAGVITSKYDGWGQLVRHAQKVHLSGDSIVTTYAYHPYGLLNPRIRNGETTNYVYDGQYRMNSVSIAGRHTQNFVYDQYDRITILMRRFA
jgi:YD repeat-containing protein